MKAQSHSENFIGYFPESNSGMILLATLYFNSRLTVLQPTIRKCLACTTMISVALIVLQGLSRTFNFVHVGSILA